MDFDRPSVPAPEFAEASWIHTPAPLSLAGLRGQTVLLHIWDYTSLNCLHSLPYLRAWHERYTDLGLVIIGVHKPEFRFARSRAQVEAAAGRLGMRWPILLDSDQQTERAYGCSALPSLCLIDADGCIRHRCEGEGTFQETEVAIQSLLSRPNGASAFPALLPPIRPEDAPGARRLPTTPALHIPQLGNPAPSMQVPLLYDPPADRLDGRFYLEGQWGAVHDGLCLAGEAGAIVLRYHAASVHAVLSPSPDPVELDLGLRKPLEIGLRQDGEPLPREAFGEDVYLAGGQARARIETARLYTLARNPDVQSHELRLEALGTGLTFYAFSFGSCLAPVSTSRPPSKE